MKYQKKKWLVQMLLSMVLLLVCACGKEQGEYKETQVSEDTSAVSEEMETQYVILSVNTEDKVMSFLNLKNQKEEQFAYVDVTFFYDEHDTIGNVEEFHPGMIVTLEKDYHSQQLRQVRESKETFVYEDIQNYSIDLKKQRIRILGKDYYYVNDKIRVFSGNTEIKIEDIKEQDVLKIFGIGRQIYSICVMAGQGEISLVNEEDYIGGWITVGDKKILPIEKDMKFPMLAGTYEVMAVKDGYLAQKEIVVTNFENTVLDLKGCTVKEQPYGSIVFQVEAEDATIYLNGKEIPQEKAIKIPYGIHNLIVMAEGYETVNKRLVVQNPKATINVDMVPEKEEVLETEEDSEKESETEKNTEKNTETESEKNTETEKDSQTQESIVKDILSTLLKDGSFD